MGNKCDMEDERVISYERGKQLADSLGLQFFETSAKENINVRVRIIQFRSDFQMNSTIKKLKWPDSQLGKASKKSERTFFLCLELIFKHYLYGRHGASQCSHLDSFQFILIVIFEQLV